MKNATKRIEGMKSLFRKLQRDRKPEPPVKLEPLQAMIRGTFMADVPDSRVDELMAIIEREFVDLNELRVATELELQEVLGIKYPGIEQRTQAAVRILNDIFEREHTLSLERLKTLNRKEARQYVHDLSGIGPFAEGFVMLFAFEAAAVPLDQTMLDYLIKHEVIADGMNLVEAQKFLETHLKSGECHDFYALVRREALSRVKAKTN